MRYFSPRLPLAVLDSPQALKKAFLCFISLAEGRFSAGEVSGPLCQQLQCSSKRAALKEATWQLYLRGINCPNSCYSRDIHFLPNTSGEHSGTLDQLLAVHSSTSHLHATAASAQALMHPSSKGKWLCLPDMDAVSWAEQWELSGNKDPIPGMA